MAKKIYKKTELRIHHMMIINSNMETPRKREYKKKSRICSHDHFEYIYLYTSAK